MEKKKFIKIFGVFMIGFSLLCFIRIYYIQHCSVWSESKLKPIWGYDEVCLTEALWYSQESMSIEDKILLYFALGSAKEYRGSEQNYELNENKNSLFNPRVIFIVDSWQRADNAAIVWEYEKNTIYVGTGKRKNERGTRYFLDKRHAKSCMNCIGNMIARDLVQCKKYPYFSEEEGVLCSKNQ